MVRCSTCGWPEGGLLRESFSLILTTPNQFTADSSREPPARLQESGGYFVHKGKNRSVAKKKVSVEGSGARFKDLTPGGPFHGALSPFDWLIEAGIAQGRPPQVI